MRRFLSNADTPRSQCLEQEEHIYLKLDKDNVVQDTVEEPIAVVKSLGENKLGPWVISKNIQIQVQKRFKTTALSF